MKSPLTLTIAAILAASTAAPVMAQTYADSEYQQRLRDWQAERDRYDAQRQAYEADRRAYDERYRAPRYEQRVEIRDPYRSYRDSPCERRASNDDRKVAGTLIGALAGAALGANIAAPKVTSEGAVLGAVVGGAIGAGIASGTDTRYVALIEEPRVRFPQPLKACKLGVLKRVLLGEAPKAVAIELRMGLSSVAAAIQDCLLGMGIPGRLSQASVLLTMAACAAHRPQSSPTLGRLSRIEFNGEGFWVVSVVRPDLQFPVPLSEAEAAVVRELLAGRSHAQISNLRATSRRTVANQLATVFRKLGVSGRGAVVHRLIQHNSGQL